MENCFYIYRNVQNNEEIVSDLSKFGYFYRSRVEKILIETSREFLKRVMAKENINSVDIDMKIPDIEPTTYVVGVNNKLGSCLIFLTEKIEEKTSHSHLLVLANQILSFGLKKTFLENFAYIQSFDKINEINVTLEETKKIMIDNISKILDRGEKVEDMLKKSEELYIGSINYFRGTEKLNSCCMIL